MKPIVCMALCLAAAIAVAGELPEAITSLEIPNARQPLGDVLTAGQLSPAQMIALRDLGYTTFISLRPGTEEGAGWEESFAGEKGIRFTRIPITGAGDLTRDRAALLGQEMAAAGSGKVALYCASSNRVGALLAVKAHTLDGLSPERSLQLGLDAGLTRLEPAVRTLLGLPGK